MGLFNIESMKKLVLRKQAETKAYDADDNMEDEEEVGSQEDEPTQKKSEEEQDELVYIQETQKKIDYSAICYDVETTGVDADNDEVIRLSIVDVHGITLFHSYIKPIKHTTWEDAERVHGISPEMVRYAPTKEEVMYAVKAIFDRASTVITFNGKIFDNALMKRWGIDLSYKNNIDVMREYSNFKKVADETAQRKGKNRYKWFTLKEVAESYGLECQWADSLERVKLTLECFTALNKEKGDAK